MKAKKKGKVYLVGAGPGDPSLITVRGLRLLQRADVIVVDDLVNPLLFQTISQAKIIYVGKRGPGAPSGSFLRLPQPGINRLLIDLAKKGHSVVRLKGGDPIIFGRGGEEMEALHRAKIPYEVVPGVTSAVAAPAYAGIPLSDRRWSSAITFLTGQRERGQVSTLHFPRKVESGDLTPSGTLVILMGVGNWGRIRSTLLAAGWPKSKPVAAIQSATGRDQKIYLATLGNSLQVFKSKKLVSPAILIVGDVVSLNRTLSWAEKEKPLLGRSVVVTRPEHQSRGLIDLLEEKGATVIPCPSIAIEPLPDDSASWATIKRLREGLMRTDWFVFLSENGVRTFFKLMEPVSNWWGKGKIMAVGPQTKAAIQERGGPVHKMAAVYNSQGILKALGQVRGKRIFLPRVQSAPKDLVEKLEKNGAHVDEVSTYRTVQAPPPSARVKELIERGVDAITFTSASTVENFAAFFNPGPIRKIFSKALALSIGPSTTAALRARKIKNILQAKESTTEAMVQILMQRMKP